MTIIAVDIDENVKAWKKLTRDGYKLDDEMIRWDRILYQSDLEVACLRSRGDGWE